MNGNSRHFVDPSIVAAALEHGPDDLMSDLATFGLLFETLAHTWTVVLEKHHCGAALCHPRLFSQMYNIGGAVNGIIRGS